MSRGAGFTREVDRLGAVVDAIARKCWRGLPSLLGQASPPGAAQIKDALTVARVDGDVDSILADWAQIVEAVQRFRAEYPDDLSLYCEFIALKETGRAAWGGESVAARLGRREGVNEWTIRGIVRSVPRRIAALMSVSIYRSCQKGGLHEGRENENGAPA